MSATSHICSGYFVRCTGYIVSDYVSKNRVLPSELPNLLNSVHAALIDLFNGVSPIITEVETEKATASQIRKSLKPDGLISFIDGQPYKTLKRHLTKHGLNPDSYRALFGLPADYPMVAANYAAQRSALAKQIGLGGSGTKAKVASTRRRSSV